MITINEQPKKVAAKAAITTPADPSPVTISDVNMDELAPGQKQALQVQLAQGERLMSDINAELTTLDKDKKQAVKAKKIAMVSEIEGLQDKLTQLEKKLSARIKLLKKQLNTMPAGVTELLNQIESQCAKYIKAVEKADSWLYRGAKGDDAFVGKSWQTRKTKDSNPQAQVVFDQMLAQLGFVALRGNSIFATSDYAHTKQFGPKTYVIFPVDNASHFTYTSVSDLTLDDVPQVATDPAVSRSLKKELASHVNDTIKALGKGNIPEALKDLKTVMTYDWYSWENIQHALREFVDTGTPHEIPAKFLDPDFRLKMSSVEYFEKKWKPKQTDLSTALKKSLEVYISGTYYALNVDVYGAYIEEKFGVEVITKVKPPKW